MQVNKCLLIQGMGKTKLFDLRFWFKKIHAFNC